MRPALVTSAAICLGIATWVTGVRAQDEPPRDSALGTTGPVAISVDRLFGYTHNIRSTSLASSSNEVSVDTIALLGTPLNGFVSPYTFPHLAADLFITPNLTIGASVSYARASASSSGTSTSINGFAATPRGGFALAITPKVSLWPRGGITFARFATASGGSTSTVYFVALTAEAPLAVSLTPQAWVLVGPALDLGLAGSASSPNVPSTSTKTTEIGIQAGLVIVL